VRNRWDEWRAAVLESATLAVSSLFDFPLRSILAISGVVIGIVTVVMVASILANVRNQVALLFRELGTENVFAFHLTGDPYQPASESEAQRKPLEARFARVLERQGDAIKEVAVQVIIPTVVNGRPLIARAGGNDSDRVLVEGASSNFFEVVGAEYTAGRPFTDLEDRAGARVAILGANLARSLYGPQRALGKSLTLGGQTYFVVGELALRPGGFLGENRQDRVLAIPLGTASRYFPEADRTVLYVRSQPERLDATSLQTEAILRRLRRIPADRPNDFTLSTAEQIIRSFDSVSRQIVFATVALAAVSLVIGGIGIANVMIMSATERTREIGVRRALGAKRRDVLRQFLLEAAFLSTVGGIAGVVVAFLLGLLVSLFVQEFSARPPLWAITAGLVASIGVGILAGYWPARRAAALDPVEALRHE